MLLTGTVDCPGGPPPVPGYCYTGYNYDLATKSWEGPGPLVFLGAALALGQLYFTIEAPRTATHPAAYIWRWLHGAEWAYLGELPAFL